MKKIIHVDMDAFYASIEQRDFPELRGKPVVVGGDPDKRGVVATCSYEARKFGIRSAMPVKTAYRLCPHANFVHTRFDVYRKVSNQIREIFFHYSDLVEPLSLDEAYLDVTENKKNCPSATLLAKAILKEIYDTTKLTASAGVSYNKFLAKVASDVNKPNGLTVITPNDAEAFIQELPIRKFYGVGESTEKKMHRIGIRDGKSLKAFSEEELIERFGKMGTYLFNIARGIDERPVKPSRERKSVSKETTFAEDVIDFEELKKTLRIQSENVARTLYQKNIKGRTINLKLRYADFTTLTRSITLNHAIDSASDIFDAGIDLLNKIDLKEKSIRLVGLGTSNFPHLDKNKAEIQLEFSFVADLG